MQAKSSENGKLIQRFDSHGRCHISKETFFLKKRLKNSGETVPGKEISNLTEQMLPVPMQTKNIV